MRINYTGKGHGIPFCDIRIGGTFMFEGSHYVKMHTPAQCDMNALALETFRPMEFDTSEEDTDLVIPTASCLNIE